MSNTIERFGQTGFISKTNGLCYAVAVNPDGQSVRGRKKLQDGFPFYSPNCKRQTNAVYLNYIGGNSFPTERGGWEIIETSPGVDENGHHYGYILRDRVYGHNYWMATKGNDGYTAVMIGPDRPGSFVEPPTPTAEPPIVNKSSSVDYFGYALKALAVLTTVALIYFGTRTILNRL